MGLIRLLVICTVLMTGTTFILLSLNAFEGFLAVHGGPEAEYKIIRHPRKKWKKIKYSCPRKMYAGTTELAEIANYKDEVVCCYANGQAKVVSNKHTCRA